MERYNTMLVERFLRYVAIESQSDATNTALPSSEGQYILAQLLEKELQELGLSDILLTKDAILTARLPGNVQAPAVGFICHLDTVDVNLSPSVKPQIRTFTGEDIVLNPDLPCIFKVDEHPEILPYKDQKIIFTDGTSVLGADDKAAIATVMTALSYLTEKNPNHGDIFVAFVPDEEIGLRGAKAMDITRFPVDFAYTIDCCKLGEVVYENFNAASATVSIQGVTAHPMSAKNVLVNPLLVATDIINSFDRLETPEHTENKEGYIWCTNLISTPSTATLSIAIRDFNKDTFEEKKQKISRVVEKVRALYPRATIELSITDVYSNIADSLHSKEPVDIIINAMKKLNIEPIILPMRGGTDGAALSSKNIPTPNYSTGAHNFHSPFEFLPIPSFQKVLQLTLTIIQSIPSLPH